jgi:acyl-CoA synthetase (AMP-forming)/AMP-acid ligase II
MLIQADLGALKTPPGKLAGAGEPLNPEVIEQVDTGDVAARDPEGYITYVGRADDVFKASGYRISPFERERYIRENLAPCKRIRRLEFSDLPKTISGKIRRVELRVRLPPLRGRDIPDIAQPDHGPPTVPERGRRGLRNSQT